MNTPSIYTPEEIVENCQSCQAEIAPGQWVMARSLGWQGINLRWRLKCAWLVFTGRADVLRWNGQPDLVKTKEVAWLK